MKSVTTIDAAFLLWLKGRAEALVGIEGAYIAFDRAVDEGGSVYIGGVAYRPSVLLRGDDMLLTRRYESAVRHWLFMNYERVVVPAYRGVEVWYPVGRNAALEFAFDVANGWWPSELGGGDREKLE